MKQERRAVIYGLITPLEQNPSQQKEELLSFGKAQGLEVIHQYWERTQSYKPQDRQELTCLINDLQNQSFGCVLVWKLSLFACNLSHLLELLREFESHQIRFISILNQWDTKDQSISQIISLIEAILTFRATIKGQRTRLGIAAAKAMGKKVGRPGSDPQIVKMIEELAETTSLSIQKITLETGNKISYATTGRITKRVRDNLHKGR